MSVDTAHRNESKLKVLTSAITLCSYTLTVCKNEGVFPKRNRWILTQKIVNEATDIVSNIRRANAVRVETPNDYAYRRSQQIEAYGRCEALLTLIDMAKANLNVDADRVKRWTGLAKEVEDLLNKWKNSDAKAAAERFGSKYL